MEFRKFIVKSVDSQTQAISCILKICPLGDLSISFKFQINKNEITLYSITLFILQVFSSDSGLWLLYWAEQV